MPDRLRWPAPFKREPAGDFQRGEYYIRAARCRNMTARVYLFRPRIRVYVCTSCGSHFRPRFTYHKICHDCYWWDAGLRHQAAAAYAFHEVRMGINR